MQIKLSALFVMVSTSCNVHMVSLLKDHSSIFPNSLAVKSRQRQSNIVEETYYSINRFFFFVC